MSIGPSDFRKFPARSVMWNVIFDDAPTPNMYLMVFDHENASMQGTNVVTCT